MSAVASFVPQPAVEEQVEALVSEKLAPMTVAIDRQGVYPADFMHQLGALGGYRQHLASQRADGERDLGGAIRVIDAVSRECMSTGFCAWCHNTMAWYLEHADDPSVRDNLLPGVADGTQLGGTGLSNGMKNIAAIEPLKIRVRRVDGGYIANGTLPWVSNLDSNHMFAAIFEEEGTGRRIMAATYCNQPGFSLQQCAEFTALEGSGTYACHFRDCFIPDGQVISGDICSLIPRIRAGFVLMQMGMGLGLVQGCIDIMEAMRETQGHVNCYLDEQPESLAEELDDARQASELLAADCGDTSDAFFADVLQVRHRASELALRASQGAMLHAGARGYLADAPAQRKLRESYFVAIVTPAIKHLRKEMERLGAT
ncbi:MAG: acyl-CoA dehydrogenase family protein [Ectothiorhodospiraceae bacterium]